jgi:hypothetical protein
MKSAIRGLAGRLRSRASLVGELGSFLWKKRLFWLIPIAAALLVIGGLVLLASQSPVTPFVYALF